jgi:hypothetical protein
MLVANGSSTASEAVWQETVKVQPNTSYVFSFWATDIDTVSYTALPQLQAYLNSAALGSALTLAASAGPWVEYRVTWTSGASTIANLSIMDLDTSAASNDFALDDVAFSACP